jgi:hypothetical protein
MKTFKTFTTEEVDLTPYVRSGSMDIDDSSVRDNINTLLHGVTGRCFVTPYIAMERVAKVLGNFHIHVPKTTFLENDSGMVTFNISQFGNKFGMQNNGEVVTKNTSPYSLYFEYRMNDKGLFDVFCEIVSQDELDEIMNDLEDELNDNTDEGDDEESLESAEDRREEKLEEAKDNSMRNMAAGLAAMTMGAAGAMGPEIGDKLIPAPISKWEMTHKTLKDQGEEEKATDLRSLIDDYKKNGNAYTRLKLEKKYKKYFPKKENLKEAKEAAMSILAEGKREAKIADAKSSLMRATQRGAPDKEVDVLTDRLRKVAGIKKRVARSAYRTNKDIEMISKANAPSSKTVNEDVKKKS